MSGADQDAAAAAAAKAQQAAAYLKHQQDVAAKNAQKPSEGLVVQVKRAQKQADKDL